MTIFKNIRLGLLHIAVAITFVAINGVLNRIMIHDLGILSTVVAGLIILPYVLSPAQVWMGQYSDTHPLWGYRRTPYILLGILLCVGGMVLTPFAALLLAKDFLVGLAVGIVAFGLWGIGYNMAVVSYLSLASDLSTEAQRSRTIAIMWFMMITSIIISAITIGRALEPYSEAQLVRVFATAGGVALLLALLGLIGLEPAHVAQAGTHGQSRTSQRLAIQAVIGNPQARLFFIYFILLMVAILGQDVLLEPFGAHAFGMSVEETTQLTALWGSTTLIALLVYGVGLSRWISKKQGATLGGIIAMSGLLLIAASGLWQMATLFRPGIAILGFGTGIATATNLGLMLDMTTTEQAGLYIGAWGVADAIARGIGMLLGGIVRDMITWTTGDAGLGYITVFFIEAIFLLLSLALLAQIDAVRFRSRQPTLLELAALSSDA